MEMIIKVFVVIYAIMCVAGVLTSANQIGKPRKPVTWGVVLVSLALTVVVIWLLIRAYF